MLTSFIQNEMNKNVRVLQDTTRVSRSCSRLPVESYQRTGIHLNFKQFIFIIYVKRDF